MGLLWGSNPYQQIALGHRALPPSRGSPASLFQVPSSWDPRPSWEKGRRKPSGPFTLGSLGQAPGQVLCECGLGSHSSLQRATLTLPNG